MNKVVIANTPDIDIDNLVKTLLLDRPSSLRFKKYLYEFLLEAYGVTASRLTPDLECFVNAQANTYAYQGRSELNNIAGSVQLCPVRSRSNKDGTRKIVAKPPDCRNLNFSQCKNLYDSGAFPEVLADARVTPQVSLARQLSTLAQMPAFKETLLVSYDRLIDEKHILGQRVKQRWTVAEGELAVRQTVEAAAYLHSQRLKLDNYTLVQSCQGVDASQYLRCVEQVLEYCDPSDVLGLGGWCILGRQPSYLPTFWQTINLVLKAIAQSQITRIHIFGCTWYKPKKYHPIPPLPPLLWLCDRYGISLSTDGRSPIGNALWKDGWQKAGATFGYWRHNLAWVKAELATLRDSPQYQAPPGYIEPVTIALSVTPEKFLEKDVKAKQPVSQGTLYQYLETKKLHNGLTVHYPHVIGERDRENASHWRWGFNWKEKFDGVWKGRSIASIPPSAVPAIQAMQRLGATREDIITFIKQAKNESKAPGC